MLYLCFGTVVGVAVCFWDFQYFLLEISRYLLGVVLVSNLGLVSGVAVTGERFLVLETNFFLS